MRFEYVGGELKSNSDKDVAKLIYDFFRYQYEQAIETDVNARAERNASIAANEAATREYEREAGLGFGARLPYDSYALKVKEENYVAAQKQRAEAKLLLNFVVKTFVDKAL
jgi:hypothetical protein